MMVNLIADPNNINRIDYRSIKYKCSIITTTSRVRVTTTTTTTTTSIVVLVMLIFTTIQITLS